jgi:uncharacterized damage-inducible protein DinB
MNDTEMLQTLYKDTYSKVTGQIEGLTHQDSFFQPPFGGNCVNWILGHLVVARCNFLMMLDVQPVWDMVLCRRFIPGSNPVTSEEEAVSFETQRTGFDLTQEQLLTALTRVTAGKLQETSGEKTVGEHLAFYNVHEAYHAGQLSVLRQMMGK